MSRRRTLTGTLLSTTAALALVAGASPALAHSPQPSTERDIARAQVAAGVPVPVFASPNVELVAAFPETLGISGVFGISSPHFYMSTTDSISAFNVRNPSLPVLTDTIVIANFENESMTYGERVINGKLRKFILVGIDLVKASPTEEPQHVNVGGGEMIIIDVTDPNDIKQVGRVSDVPNSTHTVACAKETACRYAYTAGSRGKYSIIDLTNLSAPKVLKTLRSPASRENELFVRGAGHKWNFDNAGYGLHTGSGGTAIFDVVDPKNPKVVQATNFQGTAPMWNDFIHHNTMRPNASRFRAFSPPSVANGNVALITEEDYFNDGEEVLCEEAGTIQSWYIPNLNGAAYRSNNPNLDPDKGAIRPLDMFNPVTEQGQPVGAFCSAHWFDYHSSGILAQGFYQGGTQFIDVRDPRNLKSFGFFRSAATETWDAYWVPQRDSAGRSTGRQTNLVYAVDFVQGLTVLKVTNLPRTTLGAAGPTGSPTP